MALLFFAISLCSCVATIGIFPIARWVAIAYSRDEKVSNWEDFASYLGPIAATGFTIAVASAVYGVILFRRGRVKQTTE